MATENMYGDLVTSTTRATPKSKRRRKVPPPGKVPLLEEMALLSFFEVSDGRKQKDGTRRSRSHETMHIRPLRRSIHRRPTTHRPPSTTYLPPHDPTG